MANDATEKSTGKSREKLDATGEFFSIGAPLHAVRAGYVKRRADELLYETVVAGRYAHVLAPDRSGKSSLIAATAARLENNGCKVAVLDLEQIGERDGGSDAGRWYYSVAYRLLRQLRIRYDLQSWWQDKSILSNRQRLVEFYSEVLLEHVAERIVVFVDEIQCMQDRPYSDQLLASIRAAHNARTTDPDFSRLSFVLSGECDPVSLVSEAELSPFNITHQIPLDDFNRDDLDIFATELNVDPDLAVRALDRIYYWTNGQPYLCQKLARAVSRENGTGEIEEQIDHIALHQIAGRAALHSEPHMSHIHRSIVNDGKRREALLNLYGKLRKGIEVTADLGSALQRRLMAVGLVVINAEGNLQVRNRLYGAVFTTRWANENLATQLRVPLLVAAGLLLFALVPFWYTQWLPGPYVRVLASESVSLQIAEQAFDNLRSFPGHADTATSLYRSFLDRRAQRVEDATEIELLAASLSRLPDSGSKPEEIEAAFWDRKMRRALREERRDEALLASLRALVFSTPLRRKRAASLVGDDYSRLLATLPELPAGRTVFDPVSMVLTSVAGAEVKQWTYTPQGIQQRESWKVTALEVAPLVRRVIVDREGTVSRIGLTLNISHARLEDLRIKVIAPSGRAVQVETGMERATSGSDITIPASQIKDLLGESLNGTWSISVRDEGLGVAGQLVGWNLKLNSQGAVEQFQRGLNIPDPVERETDNIWFDRSGRYAIARAVRSDSARLWDLSFAEPVRAIAVGENESFVGLDSSARQLVTSTQDHVNIWDTASGDKIRSLAVGSASLGARLTPDRSQLFVVHRGDADTRLELWSLQDGEVTADLTVAGSPAAIALDRSAQRVAIADFDRAVRLWDVASNELLGQYDLAAQPSEIKMSADGATLAAVFADSGVELWNTANPGRPVLRERGQGQWKIAFSPSGQKVAVGRPVTGYQIYDASDGRLIGPALGLQASGDNENLLAFSSDEQVVVTGSGSMRSRFWRILPAAQVTTDVAAEGHKIWSPSADSSVLVTPDASKTIIGDALGHLHFLPAGASLSDVESMSADVSYLGHNSSIKELAVDASGKLVASVAEDNTIRVWDVQSEEPLSWVLNQPGSPINRLLLEPGGASLVISSGNRIKIVDTSKGATLATFESVDAVGGLTFAGPGKLYVGTKGGALQLIQEQSDRSWQMRQVWRGNDEIRVLKASPRGDYLILVDKENRASQFVLAAGSLTEETLQLPSDVLEIVFDEAGTRLLARTSRWVHTLVASPVGLRWSDAVLLPRPLKGAQIAFRTEPGLGRAAVLPVARNGYIDLLDIDISSNKATALFGSRSELLDDWLRRVNAIHPAGSERAAPDFQP